MLDDALRLITSPRSASRPEMLDDPRVIAAIYRAAVELGLMGAVRYRDPALTA